MSLSLEEYRKVVDEIFSYTFTKYFTIGDTLIQILVKTFPWFSAILKEFEVYRVLYTYYKVIGEVRTPKRIYTSLNPGVLSRYVEDIAKSINAEVPTYILDPSNIIS